MNRVEELARELKKIYNGFPDEAWNDIECWKCIATHVLLREIEARIEELEEPSTEDYKVKRLSELTTIKQGLGGES